MGKLSSTLWLILFVLPQQVLANSQFNMRKGVTDISNDVYQLHMTIFIICCVIGVIVFAVMFWALIHHRKSKGAKPAQFHESTKVEILWTAIPFVILIGMAIPATKTLIAMEDASKADLTIKITGSQWKWHYEYMGEDVEFYSMLATPQDEITNLANKNPNYLLEVDKPLVLPINQKVRFLMTSDDVIHSWWVPDFAVKKDANPGFINETWTRINEEGIYRGQCAELCGKDHGFMPVVVEAKSEQAFANWLSEAKQAKANAAIADAALLDQTLPKEELMTLGEQVYMASCAACHQPTGMGLPGVFPALKGSPVVLGDIKDHIDVVLHGRPGTAMQAFDKQLSIKQLAAVITYKRNAWGNDTGDVIQPSQIQAAIDATSEAK
ncbi:MULTISPECIES: cytochrome c oxidase subunit II [Pseudoalteromonas]|jgi:cytochrome c oxidase subunit 2|uniref:Cytochrome c oxidase subunit 2 n=2 Tax=Pseudoalteromonas TaxID=53246 RepID=A0ABY3FD10_9GAMM|nr:MULTISPECIES: cytochrome c oxidase subunit II [Pseudoalteromonas]MBB1292791.1 cytochrome c oxidase subunit II [Pseudoalteromonas sp. SR41-4]MBB1301925.1 cytochrome c oxidase subunit II [Pseudoalteromonas sp. SR44-8]MBB1341921.1 cytochrome c oxidase subunit II [Pseudoalteromonas sp. SR45-6]MBB1398921.1 cytochrome c oxidase subunit II [Pseudoalteromonas sp. SG44-8]MBB1410036.1 cytochrome c oxidase subunit II [Pseudoalteromonas sp. SG44-17]|tara:strand:+ start:21446 stop:22588 length:1143 start_codon:yes stop_codon:yes gene_type:complete